LRGCVHVQVVIANSKGIGAKKRPIRNVEVAALAEETKLPEIGTPQTGIDDHGLLAEMDSLNQLASAANDIGEIDVSKREARIELNRATEENTGCPMFSNLHKRVAQIETGDSGVRPQRESDAEGFTRVAVPTSRLVCDTLRYPSIDVAWIDPHGSRHRADAKHRCAEARIHHERLP
jgi:hypothetical protein